jgi:hypothetical protein
VEICLKRIFLAGLTASVVTLAAGAEAPFALRVVDAATGRGVPLVELKGVSGQIHLTDSHGYVAIDDPTLLRQRVFFHLRSHGYEYPAGAFGYRGEAIDLRPGGEITLRIKRLNVAERLYRITGAGIYRDSVKLVRPVPIARPLLNAQVCGQDTVQTVVVGDTVHWFWGDTNRLAHPLGQFNTSGAFSKLPRAGGLPPDRGVDLEYFVGGDGFSRPMFKRENGVLIWVHGAFGLEDPGGKLRVLAHYSRRKSLTEELSAGLAVLNDRTDLFEHVLDCPNPHLPAPRGQAFRYRDEGREYVAFATPFPLVRVRADWTVAMDPRQWESFTPLVEGTVWQEGAAPRLERGADGRVRWAWKRYTGVVDRGAVQTMLESGELEARDNWLHTVDAADGRAVRLHAGSVKWNEYRRRWILIAHEIGGGPSFLGEVWYAEGHRPEGPFRRAVRIVTHDNYSFYNVAQHDFFDEDGGRTIYFEGTYTAAFAKAAVPTPWYDYNQIMYRLDLGDPRLQGAFID